MVGVTHYSGSCPVCELPEEQQEETNVSIIAAQRSYSIRRRYPGITVRDIRQYRKQCVPELAARGGKYE
jgi:hypothetical protein